jgi:hypothetical protein
VLLLKLCFEEGMETAQRPDADVKEGISCLILLDAYQTAQNTEADVKKATAASFNQGIDLIPLPDRVDFREADRPWEKWISHVKASRGAVSDTTVLSGKAPTSLFIYAGMCMAGKMHATVVNFADNVPEIWPLNRSSHAIDPELPLFDETLLDSRNGGVGRTLFAQPHETVDRRPPQAD